MKCQPVNVIVLVNYVNIYFEIKLFCIVLDFKCFIFYTVNTDNLDCLLVFLSTSNVNTRTRNVQISITV